MKENILIFFDFVKKLYKSRYMLKMLSERELKAGYVGSAFGLLWTVFNPLFQVALYGLVFGVFFKSRPDAVYNTDSFFLFLFCGLVPWQYFAQTVSNAPGIITSNLSLVKKAVGFPSEILPIIGIILNLIHHFINLAMLFIVLAIFSVKFTPAMTLIIVYMFLISLFTTGLSWILSSLNVFLKDTQQITGLLVNVWFFATPVFYTPGIVPASFLPILKLNPMYQATEGYRLALLAGMPLSTIDFAYLAGISCVVFAIGGIFFRKLKPWFAEVL